jgi:hypothetical protein
MSDLENIERYADSLYGELEAEKHNHRKDNAYLLGDIQRLRNAIEDYILWEPGRRGHAEAHRKLVATLRETRT